MESLQQNTIENALARPLEQITVEIQFYKSQTVQNIIEIGKRLIEAKEQLEHGGWLDWLQNEVEFSERSAQRFMRIAKNYPNASPVSDLSCTKLLALLQVPEEEREQFLAESHLVNGEEKMVQDMTKRELEQAVRERDEANQRAEESGRLLKKASADVNKISSQFVQEQAKSIRLQDELGLVQSKLDAAKLRETDAMNRLREAQRQLEEAASRPVDVAVREPSPAEMERLREEGRQEIRRQFAKQQEEKEDFSPPPEELLNEADEAFTQVLGNAVWQYQIVMDCSAPDQVAQHVQKVMAEWNNCKQTLDQILTAAQSMLCAYHGKDLPDWMDDGTANA